MPGGLGDLVATGAAAVGQVCPRSTISIRAAAAAAIQLPLHELPLREMLLLMHATAAAACALVAAGAAAWPAVREEDASPPLGGGARRSLLHSSALLVLLLLPRGMAARAAAAGTQGLALLAVSGPSLVASAAASFVRYFHRLCP